VYALIVERLERHVLAERQVAIFAKGFGDKRAQVPNLAAYRERLDRELEVRTGPRRVYDTETTELIAAVGLGR
jgi:hypothetical protein